jgi:hypothetical protein
MADLTGTDKLHDRWDWAAEHEPDFQRMIDGVLNGMEKYFDGFAALEAMQCQTPEPEHVDIPRLQGEIADRSERYPELYEEGP